MTIFSGKLNLRGEGGRVTLLEALSEENRTSSRIRFDWSTGAGHCDLRSCNESSNMVH